MEKTARPKRVRPSVKQVKELRWEILELKGRHVDQLRRRDLCLNLILLECRRPRASKKRIEAVILASLAERKGR